MSTKTSHLDVRKLAFMGMLTALMIVMTITPIGYPQFGTVEITFMLIPVSIGAIIFGPSAGAYLGGVFGLTSFVQCFGFLRFSLFGSLLFSINPILTFIVCMVPRILVGWATGYIYEFLNKKDKTKFLSYSGACLASALLNTLLFVLFLLLFFGRPESVQTIKDGFLNAKVPTSFSPNDLWGFVAFVVGRNGVIEAIACFVLGSLLSKTLSVLSKMAIKK